MCTLMPIGSQVVLEFTHDPAWALVFATIVLAAATVTLAGFALYQGVEARRLRSESAKLLRSAEKDRKFRLIDSKLQNAFYPIYETLRTVIFGERRAMEEGKRFLTRIEMDGIQNIVTRYGYLLDPPPVLRLVQKSFIESREATHILEGQLFGFQESELNIVFDRVKSRVEELTKQLQDITN